MRCALPRPSSSPRRVAAGWRCYFAARPTAQISPTREILKTRCIATDSPSSAACAGTSRNSRLSSKPFSSASTLPPKLRDDVEYDLLRSDPVKGWATLGEREDVLYRVGVLEGKQVRMTISRVLFAIAVAVML